MTIHDLPTPAVLIDAERLEANLRRMQDLCDRAGVELWPHVKTHKMVRIARRQLQLGAAGLTCAKLSEAEALISCGVRRLFVAYSLVDPQLAPRLRELAGRLDELLLAVTSLDQCDALRRLLEASDVRVKVLMAADTGLLREGVRNTEQARELADRVRANDRMELAGIYTHEGHTYRIPPQDLDQAVDDAHNKLRRIAEAAGNLPLWPGCSVTVRSMLGRPGVRAVRPGAYVFGDLLLADSHHTMEWDDVALTVLTTVVDRPSPDLALIDAGSKTLTSDKTGEGLSAKAADTRELAVNGVSEEHGFLRGNDIGAVSIGERFRLIPAHVCPVVNLASFVYVVDGEQVSDRWPVDARGCCT